MDKTKATMTVVCDAGPVIHLDELGCLHLLSDFQEIFLPDTVWKEIGQHRPSALKRTGLSLLDSISTVCREYLNVIVSMLTAHGVSPLSGKRVRR